MTVTIYLRGADEAVVLAALVGVGLAGPSDVEAWGFGHGDDRVDLVRIGTVMWPTGETAPDPETGEDFAVMAPADGWHANLYLAAGHPQRAAIEAGLAAVTITPEGPVHRRAGMAT